jgi:hypothetical protein
MDNMISEGLLSSNVFGVYLGKEINGGGGGMLINGF